MDKLPARTLLQELEQNAGKLPEAERAALVSRLLASRPRFWPTPMAVSPEPDAVTPNLTPTPLLISRTNNFGPQSLLPENDESSLPPERPTRRLRGAGCRQAPLNQISPGR